MPTLMTRSVNSQTGATYKGKSDQKTTVRRTPGRARYAKKRITSSQDFMPTA